MYKTSTLFPNQSASEKDINGRNDSGVHREMLGLIGQSLKLEISRPDNKNSKELLIADPTGFICCGVHFHHGGPSLLAGLVPIDPIWR